MNDANGVKGNGNRARLAGADGRLLKGYAPLVGILVLYALVVWLTPSVAREEVVQSPTGAGSIGGAGTGSNGSAGLTPGAPGGPNPGGAGTGGPNPDGAGPGGAGPGAVAPPPGGGLEAGQPGLAATGTTTSCGPQQVPGDPYSPPCVEFSGDNGGATSRGVTADTIRISYRLTSDPGLQAILGQLANGRDLPQETPDDVRRTAEALVQYFNDRFQLYGRTMELVEFQGRGSAVNEAIGGGQDLANADAIQAAQEIGAFGDASALTSPYANALVQQGVMAFGAPYMSRAWFEERAPYAWSIVPDCTQLAELNIAGYMAFLHGRPAEFAGGDLQGRPRTLAVIAPNSPVYQQCVDDGLELLQELGGPQAFRLDYTLDPGSMSAQAGNLIDQLVARNITSVALGTDPLLPLFLTQQASERGYYPEWLVLGTALTDADIAAQQYDQEQWRHAFGISQLGPQTDSRATYGYQAYKAIRPGDEPSITVDLLYYQLYQIALGLQLAGPDLTPETYAQGMFLYPGGTGMAGTWRFAPGDYTAQDDGVAIWWDAEGISPYNGKPGRYIQASPRGTADALPPDDPTFFQR